jgi:ectonucleotide pyrophosphatase/phosphodiesterase family member 5
MKNLYYLLFLATLHSIIAIANSDKKHPYVILISIDGYRYDYNQLYKPKFLSKFAKDNFSAKSLRPVYPSKTFPNHISAITGVHPEEHGIIANKFYDSQTKRIFSIGDEKEKRSPIWYKSPPLWVKLEKKGIKTASYFWPGSDVAIDKTYPSYFKHYRRSVPGEEKITQVIEWLNLPLNKRPKFISLYFSAVDTAGHHHGPDSKELKDAIFKVDKHIKNLYKALNKIDIEYTMIVISDHGMQKVNKEKIFYLSNYLKLTPDIRVIGRGSFAMLYLEDEKNKKNIIEQLQTCPHIKAYTKNTIPPKYHFSKSQHIAPIIVEVLPPYYMLINKKDPLYVKGDHGYSPFISKEMHGIFYAKGDSFPIATVVDTFSITNVYKLISNIYFN